MRISVKKTPSFIYFYLTNKIFKCISKVRLTNFYNLNFKYKKKLFPFYEYNKIILLYNILNYIVCSLSIKYIFSYLLKKSHMYIKSNIVCFVNIFKNYKNLISKTNIIQILLYMNFIFNLRTKSKKLCFITI